MSTKVILTDIEGTTSSMAFVHQVLFPYSRDALPAFLQARAEEPEVRAQLEAVAIEAGCDPRDRSLLLAHLLGWIDADRKVTPLKALQGMIWEQGYAEGQLQSHIYPDAAQALRRWHAEGLSLYVYSSGSVAAQKLLFEHTAEGDLSPLFSGYFDTHIGGKKESRSYLAITEAIGCKLSDMMFLSDVGAELDAASSAGMPCVQVCRAEDGTTPAPGHRQVASFAEIEI